MLPKEGITVESCLIGAWHKDIGDPVSQNDILFDYETDKAAFECISTADGVLLHKFYQEGDEAPVLTPAAIIGEIGEDISSLIYETSAGAGSERSDETGSAATESDGDDIAPAEDVPPAGDAPSESITPSEAARTEADGGEMTQTAEAGEDAGNDIGNDTSNDAGGDVNISPRARIYASEHGVDLSKVVPTGPNGRILETDIIAAVNAAPQDTSSSEVSPDSAQAEPEPVHAEPEPDTAQAEPDSGDKRADQSETADSEAIPPYIDEPFTKIRAVIAKTMTASLHRSAQVTNHHSFDATSVLAMRKDFKSSEETLGYKNVSLGDIVLYVVSRRLAVHPEINALVADEGIRKYNIVNLGVAVDTPRGLLVPTIFNAEKKSLKEISKEIRELADAARESRISPDLLQGGTFTVSNLGTTGVEFFTPIINPPQAAILGVCGISERVRKDENGQLVLYPSIGLSFTYDHRAVDGAPASRFVSELCEDLTSFSWKTLAIESERGQ
jgi:pyruvate dehydrogenase E2 component (dihydrolipoamide acetyltransferase)